MFTEEEAESEEEGAHIIKDKPSDESPVEELVVGEVVLKRTGGGCNVGVENNREKIREILRLDREIAKLNATLRLKEDLEDLISAANCAEEQRKDPERANLCSRGEEHNDTAAVAAGSPKPTRRPAPLAVGDQVQTGRKSLASRPLLFPMVSPRFSGRAGTMILRSSSFPNAL